MSWAVPSIAAELWGVTLDHVMGQIRAGAVVSREEFGFTWVEVSAQSLARPARRVRRRGRRSPQTYTRRPVAPVVPAAPSAEVDELRSLGEAPPEFETEAPNGTPKRAASVSDDASEELASVMVDSLCAPEPAEPPEPDECESPEDPDDGVAMNWREARSRAAATRRRPPGI